MPEGRPGAAESDEPSDDPKATGAPVIGDAATPIAPTGPPGDSAVSGAAPRKGPRRVRAGDLLGRYELGEELGEGGMATVFRARDRELRRDVAVKVLFPHLARRPEIVRRFQREARAAAGLDHPNILRIYDVGGGDGDEPPYLVMELVRGPTLLQEIEQRGAMLSEVTACIGAVLGDALAAAHAAGIIHRDVKPANVLIAPGGKLLLGDFGVARLETEDSLVTRTGALLGTPAYMSPEQAAGDVATARSDLYSLGATLYQLATGALPYTGPPAKIMSMIAAGNLVPPVRRRPAVGAELSRMLERTMAVDPAARPASATALAEELRGRVAAGGLGEPAEELAVYFADPAGFLRLRMPTITAALVAAGNAAVDAGRLPRAMSLADRAAALAPEDPGAVALVRRVTEGGLESRRRRALAIAGAALIAVAAAGVIWQRARTRADDQARQDRSSGSATDRPSEAPIEPAAGGAESVPAAPVANASPVAAAAGGAGAESVPAAPVANAPVGGGARAGRDPRPPTSGIGAPPPRRPAAQTSPPPTVLGRAGEPVPPLASLAPSIGAGEVAGASASEVAPPPPAPGYLVVHNDLWCTIFVDGVSRGNRRNEPLDVAAGHHTVRCVNPAGSWTQGADVAPGATQVLSGSVARALRVTLAIDATISGTAYARGSVVTLKPGVIEVVAGDRKQFLSLRESCTLRDVPELACFP